VQQRRIVITGVNRGLGRALAERFVERGHRVWGTSRNGDAPAGVVSCTHLDLRAEGSIIDAADRVAQETDGIDLLINSAGADARSFGASDDHRGPFDFDAATFNAVLEANVTGPMLVTRHLLPLLARGSSPMIVNVSSQLGSMQVAARKGRDTAYCVSKAALNMLSVKSAAELGDAGIGVVMLHPGWIATDMGGPSAPLDVDDVSRTIASTIDALTIDDSGRFIRWDGHDHPW
jgi:NAD(P)-dependent dehydrogenase (short-subunit alcohol dehydrogenase family)